jgi:hypothetical protein
LADKHRIGVMSVAVSKRNVRMVHRVGAVAICADRVDTMLRLLQWTNEDRAFLTRSVS